MDTVVANQTLDSEPDSTGTSLELLLVVLHYVVAMFIIGSVVFSRFVGRHNENYDDGSDVEEGDGRSDTFTPSRIKASPCRSI